MLPPPLAGLAAAPSVKDSLSHAIIGGTLPAMAVNNASLRLPDGTPNSRFVPPARVVRRTAKEMRRTQRGGPMSDGQRVDLLVRAQLVQRQLVLRYVPGNILVLSTPWALERAANEGQLMVASDAKVDTVTGVPSKWSSIRCKVPLAVWIAPNEDSSTVYEGATALANNVACSAPNCDHAFFVDYGADGSITMRRRCQRWYAPAVCIDKHLPSFHGFQKAGYGWRSLCDFHGFQCFEEKLKGLSIKGDSAVLAMWAFRLIKRAESTAKASMLRDEFVRVIIAAALPHGERAPMWTLETATELVGYLDRCWMYPPFILEAWIDAKGLDQAGYISTTAFCESGHMYWSKFLMHSLSNKIVSHTIVKTIGITADGSRATSLFTDAERRWTEEQGQTRAVMPDVLVRRAKAHLAFLEHGTTLLVLPSDYGLRSVGCTGVKPFNNSSIRRHSEGAAERRTLPGVSPPFPAALQPMRCILAHGGTASFTLGAGVHVLDDKTGRCTCLDSTYRGVLSAIGPCKHKYYQELVDEAESTTLALGEVHDRVLGELKRYLRAREGSKPSSKRCTPLYDATSPTSSVDAQALVSLLRRHPSIPPSGKGEQPPPPPPRPSTSDEEGRVDEEAECDEEEVLREESRPALQCTFRSVEQGLGLMLRASREGAIVVAFVPLADSAFGPALHDGERISPGDLVVCVNGESEVGKLIAEDGQLRTGSANTVELRFHRQPRGAAEEVGGANAKLTAKHNWAARKAGRGAAASAAQPGWGTSGAGTLSGGSPRLLRKKPEHTRASRMRTASEPAQKRTRGEASSAALNEQRAQQLLERLLESPQLTEAQQGERDAELAGATYIK